MSITAVFLPLVAGILMVACPEMFYNYRRRSTFPDRDMGQACGKIRKIGCVFLGAEVLYVLLTLAHR